MNHKNELRILEDLLNLIENSEIKKRRGWAGWLASFVTWIGLVLVFFLVFRYGGNMGWPHFLLAGACLLIGFGVAYDMYKSLAATRWPVMIKYMDRAQIEKRIAELRM